MPRDTKLHLGEKKKHPQKHFSGVSYLIAFTKSTKLPHYQAYQERLIPLCQSNCIFALNNNFHLRSWMT